MIHVCSDHYELCVWQPVGSFDFFPHWQQALECAEQQHRDLLDQHRAGHKHVVEQMRREEENRECHLVRRITDENMPCVRETRISK